MQVQVNAILAGIAAILAVPTVLTLLNEGSEFTDYSEQPKMFPGFSKERVAMIAVTKPKDAAEQPPDQPEQNGPDFVFVKQDGKWQFAQGDMAGANCQEYPINQILDPIKDIPADKESVIIADAKPEDLERAGLDGRSGIRIDCLDADRVPLAQFFIGKELNEGDYGQDKVKGRFVRRVAGDQDDGRKSVVLFEKDYWNVSTAADEYVDKTIHEFQAEDVKKFSVRNPKGTMAFERKDDNATQWVKTTGPDGVGAVRQSEVDNLLARFTNMSAQSFDRPLQAVPSQEQIQYGLVPRAKFEVSVELKDGKKHAMYVGNKLADKNEYWAKFDGATFLCTIGDWVVTSFEKDPKDYFDPVAPEQPKKDGDDPAKKDGDGKGGE